MTYNIGQIVFCQCFAADITTRKAVEFDLPSKILRARMHGEEEYYEILPLGTFDLGRAIWVDRGQLKTQN